MRLVMLMTACVMALSGCSGLGVGVPSTPGAFIVAPQGRTFEPMDTLDPRNAMVYIYRPITRWGYEEVQAPTLFLNSTQLFGLKAGAYEWLELNAGTYDFYARRPLSVLYLKTIFDSKLKVEGGKDYYFRYSETRPLDLTELVANPEDYLQDGPLQQVPPAIALREIADLRLDEPGLYYGNQQEKTPRWAPFYTYSEGDAVQEGDKAADATDKPGLLSRTRSWFASLF
ncbi:hypothetical protein A11A3_16365 [Alcanivorax hongdengensis A-11-3]|uniref:DUF2846 domain-containing protein n=1 Tax=Alcanivorax hongdengensis A-11-3 TaxID=1177179 RepID=L0WA24_9GAMM|nr:DUF2846 domain-containing protein [Alcanivorax hongdengensis]EKF72907.1 hypothetical protein A11A3_16365 [Alcanivorax hongdengensis A-11-3]